MVIPVKFFVTFTSSMITMQNLVAVSHVLCLHVRSQKIWGCCGPHTLIWWTSLTLETCYSPMCITIPDFLALGQTVFVVGRYPENFRDTGALPFAMEHG